MNLPFLPSLLHVLSLEASLAQPTSGLLAGGAPVFCPYVIYSIIDQYELLHISKFIYVGTSVFVLCL